MRGKPRADLTGMRVHKWEVLRFSHIKPPRIQYWWCRCDCGTERAVLSQSLREAVTKSCGCEKGGAIAAARTTHGGSDHPLYSVWQAMKARCMRKSQFRYKDYGGRGISIAPEWMTFERFRQDVEPTWLPGLTLDRKDVNGDYGPGNFRWATMIEQCANKRRTVLVEFEGEMIATPTLARRYGISSSAVLARYRAGKSGHDLIMRGKSGPKQHGG